MNNKLAVHTLIEIVRDYNSQIGQVIMSELDISAIKHAIKALKQHSKAGSVKSRAKAKASRENGKLGGRPRKS